MIVAAVIQDGLDVLRPPLAAGSLGVLGRAVVMAEGVGLRDSRSHVALCGKRIDEVAHHRVADAVADKDDGEFAEQLAHEPCRPSLGQVGTPEVRCREDEIRAVFALDDTAMQVHQARPAVPLWQRQLRRRVNDGDVRGSFEESLVEVGRDEASAVFGSAQLDERLVNAQFTGWRCREPLDDRVPKCPLSQPIRSFQ